MVARLTLAWLAGVITALGIAGFVNGPAETRAAPPAQAAAPTMKGLLAAPDYWAAYKARFVGPDGRVVDDGNGGISHSEGQGYAMLLAVAADDRAAFDLVWAWTRAELMVRPDGLAAWKWDPAASPRVSDPNNATDGDILIAWALAEAAEAWGEAAHRAAARRIARAVGRSMLVEHGGRLLLLPGADGFAPPARGDGPVVNLSYWVFPAFERLAELAPEIDWRGLARGGLSLAADARFGKSGLPSDWIALGGDKPVPADGFQPSFAYNAVRVPLYLAWARAGQRGHLAPFASAWEKAAPAVVDVASGRALERLDAPGYRAVAAVVSCALDGTKFPTELRGGSGLDLYYPSTLKALSMIAVRQRYPACW